MAEFTQYIGVANDPCGYTAIWWNKLKPLDSSEVQIGEYKFVIEKYNRRIVSKTCKVCEGTPTFIDTNGCQHWDASVPVYGKVIVKEICGPSSPTWWGKGCNCCNCAYIDWGYSGETCERKYESGYPQGTWCCYAKTQQVGTQIEDCGGVVYKTDWGSSYRVKVYKNGQLVDTLGTLYGTEGTELTYSKSYNIGYVKALFGDERQYCYYSFVHMQNSYNLNLPSDTFGVTISPAKTSYFRGETALINIKIINNFWIDVEAEIKLHICMPTFAGEYCDDIIKTETIKKGENIFAYQIPTENVEAKLTITPNVIIRADPAKIPITGVNYDCNKDGAVEPITLCNMIDLAGITGDSYTITISPPEIPPTPPPEIPIWGWLVAIGIPVTIGAYYFLKKRR